jgi:CDP-glucose 4,6-dehydratase
MLGDFYRGKRVFVTGHTGFKGSWLCEWLLKMGAEVHGYALSPSNNPSLFNILRLEQRCTSHTIGDIQDLENFKKTVQTVRPEIAIHMAAQPLVRDSYADPLKTWRTNVMGTANFLEIVRQTESVKSCVVVTTDKCYENNEWVWGYRETDPMGGHDPYSASKGAAELVTASYRKSFLSSPNSCRVASARAGNVIGGGDWSKDRIVVDFVNSVSMGQPVCLRNPHATRPWQHVLEPLSGYLLLAKVNYESLDQGFAEAWNFGPGDASVVSVKTLATKMVESWGQGSVEVVGNANQPHEAGLLKLDCSKALAKLAWKGVWGVEATVQKTVEWYKAFYQNDKDMLNVTSQQIDAYMDCVGNKNP